MLVNYFILPTVIWAVLTTLITLWITRMYINSIYALSIGGTKKEMKPCAQRNGKVPFVSVLIPTYNEARVINRILSAVTAFDYPNYEVIVADDSTDPSMLNKLEAWRAKGVKVLHRPRRSGFKAGALNNAIEQTNKKCRYILLFDADYVPQKDIIWQMLPLFSNKKIAAVQGYTKHTLNASKNLWTKSVSLAFTAYSLVDMFMRKRLNGFVPLFGSVTMISKEILLDVGGFNESSITEDYELASRLIKRGHTIIFDERISVPAECPSSFVVLVKQQMRWAEGITRDTKNNLVSLLLSNKVNPMKKFDYVYYGFGSLNGIIGTLSYVLMIFVFLVNQHIIAYLGIDSSLVLNLGLYGSFLLFVAPLYITVGIIIAALAGLYRENRLMHFKWCAYFYLVSLTLTPFIALSGLRGLIVRHGAWTRTQKTGEVISRSAKRSGM